jgi:predicted XRE-type DNA-binding protein
MKSARGTISRTLPQLGRALGLSRAQLAEIQVRSELCDKIATVVERRGLTHVRIARAAGTSQERLAAILKRNVQGVSTALLLRILGTLHKAVRKHHWYSEMTTAQLKEATKEYDREWTAPGLPGKPLTSADRAHHKGARRDRSPTGHGRRRGKDVTP